MADNTVTINLKAISDFSDVTKNVNTLQKSFSKLKMPDKLSDSFKKNFSEIDGTVEQIQKKLADGIRTPGDVLQLEKLFNRLSASAGQIADRFNKGINSGKIQLNIDGDEDLARIQTKIDDLSKEKIDIVLDTGDLQKAEQNFLSLANNTDKAKAVIKDYNAALASGDPSQITKAEAALKKYVTSRDNLLSKQNDGQRVFTEAFHEIVDASGDAQSQVEELTQKVTKLQQELEEVRNAKLDPDSNGMREYGSNINRTVTETNNLASATLDFQRRQQEAAADVENLRNQIKNYFGLDEIFRKIGDAVRDAFDTIKELDKAMTETAVVTSFDVGDMWKKLPEYTKEANALGSSISDVYNATTLYYQQGLNTAQSMGLANETLKMARIAGMDAADATDAMTAALRGFNMEVNQTSAQRINDVYSKLAADTAADTQEISTAMEKTASIANSAGMDFGTTSAFLSQMIETTREAPENLGTAMKTVIARFQELKNNPLTMVDEEGEFLDRNKVDTALKSIGVSLTDAQGEFRNLDDVFLEISSKWDTLTKSQQRYIATTAAGSRQQSRFIAMMQNYDRTMELVESANNSAGASDEQFSKTLESVDSKLNRLNNAWQQFTMGIANDTFVKFAIDGATTILDLVTEIIDTVSKIGIIDPFQGLIKSGLSMVAMFKALSLGSKLMLKGVDAVADRVIAGKTGETVAGGAIANRYMTPEQQAAIKEQQQQKQQQQQQYKKRVQERRQKGEDFWTARLGAVKEGELDVHKNDLINSEGFRNFEESTRAAIVEQVNAEYANAEQTISEKATKRAKSDLETSLNHALESGDTDTAESLQQQLDDIGSSEVYKKAFLEEQQAIASEKEKKIKENTKKETDKAKEAIKGAKSKEDATQAAQNFGIISEESVQRTNKVSSGLDRVSSGAMSAGRSFQQLGMAMSATPLAPVGQAISVFGSALEGVSGLLDTASNAFDNFMKAAEASSDTIGAVAESAESASNVAAATTETVETGANTAAVAAEEAENAANEKAVVTETAEAVANTAAAGAEAAEAEATVAATTSTVGFGTALNYAKTSLIGFLAPLMPFVVALGVVAFIAYECAAAIETQGEKMERLGKAADEANAAVDTTKNALESLNNDLDSLKSNEEAFEGLVKGTTEWNSQLAENNALVTDLLSKYDSLNEIDPATGNYKYIQTDESTGVMSITDAGKAMLKEEKTNAKNMAQAVSQIAQARAQVQKNEMTDEYKKNERLASNRKSLYASSAEDIKTQRRAEAQLNAQNTQNAALQESATNGAISAITKNLSLENTDAITDSLTKGYERLAQSQVVDKSNKTQNMRDYAKFMGYTYNEDEKKLYSGEDEVTVDYDAMLENLKDMKALENVEKYAKVLDNMVSTQNSTFEKTLKDSGIDTKEAQSMISDLLSSNEQTDTDALRKALDSGAIDKWITTQKDNYSDDNARALELQLGLAEGSINSVQQYESAINQLSNTLKTNAQNILDLDTEHVQGAVGALKGAGFTDEATVKKLLETMGSAQYTALGKNAENIGDNIGQKYAKQYAKTVGNLYSGNAESQAAGKELQGIFTGVDMSNATDALLAYQTAADSANKSISKLGKEVVEGYKGAELAATGLQDAYTGLSSDQLKTLQEASASQGGITSSTVQELGVFQNYLDATGMSAGSLANVLNDLTNGNISFDNLTAGVVSFYNELGKANNAVSVASTYGENFEVRDTSNAASVLKEAQTSRGVKREDYYRQIFGADNYDALLAKNNFDFKKTNNSLSGNIDKFMSNDKINVDAVKALAKKYKYNMDDMVEAMQKQYKFSEDTAQAIIGGAQGQSDSLRTKLTRKENKNAVKAYKKSGKDYAQEMGASQVDSLYSYSDMKTIAKKNKSGKQRIAFWESMAEQVNISKGELDKLLKQSGGERNKDYQNAIKKKIKEQDNVLLKEAENTKQANAELGKLYKTDKDGNFINEQGKQLTGEDIEKAYSAVSKDQATADKAMLKYFQDHDDIQYAGQDFQEGDLKNVETMRAAMERMTDNSQWVTVGQTIGKEIVAAWENRGKDDDNGGNNNDSSKSSSSSEYGTASAIYSKLGKRNKEIDEEIARIKGAGGKLTTDEQNRITALEQEQAKIKKSRTAYEEGNYSNVKDVKNVTATKDQQQKYSENYNRLQAIDKLLTEYGHKKNLSESDQNEVERLKLENKQLLQQQAQYKKGNYGAVEKEVNVPTNKVQEINKRNVEGAKETKSKIDKLSKDGNKNAEEISKLEGELAKYKAAVKQYKEGNYDEITDVGKDLKNKNPKDDGSNSSKETNIDSSSTEISGSDTTIQGGSVTIEGSQIVGQPGNGANGGITGQPSYTPSTPTPPPSSGGKGSSGSGTANGEPVEVPLKGKLNAEDVEVKGEAEIKVKPNPEGLNVVKQKINAFVKQPSEKTIKVKTTKAKISADVDGNKDVNKLNKSINKVKGRNVNVSANVDGTAEVKALKNAVNDLPKSRSVDISANVVWGHNQGTISVSGKTIKIVSAAKGMNNQGYGSLASGTSTGRIGPKGRGGLTLTGEEGYEIAWLPNESRSMIVGANGPQMVNLPSNAVVWDHKQSETILKKNSGMSLGSLAKGTIDAGSAAKKKKTKLRPAGFIANGGNAKQKKANKKAEMAILNLSGVISENKIIIETWGRTVDKVSKKLDKAFSNVGTSTDTLNKYIKNLTDAYNEQVKAANRELKNAKALRKKANKSKKQGSVSVARGAGSGAKSDNFYYTEGGLIMGDGNGGVTINRKYIKKQAAKGKTNYQRNEIYSQLISAAEGLVSTYNGYVNDAIDAQQAAKEGLQELRDQIKENFYTWKNELTEIQNLTGQIDVADSLQGTLDSTKSLIETRLKAGFMSAADGAEEFKSIATQNINSMISEIRNRTSLVSASQSKLRNDITSADERAELKAAKAAYGKKKTQKNLARVEAAQAALDAVTAGRKYIKFDSVNGPSIKSEKLESDRRAGKITQAQYEAIKEYYDTLLDDVKNINSQISDLQGAISDLYQQYIDEYSQADDIAKTLMDGMETESQNEIDALSSLNESLTDALNDLLDGVQRALEKQRQAEENRKTEQDISDQMNRLAILRADTSGGHAVEIAQLEKDIREATGDYEDTLEDQMLDELRDQADQAAKQREKQIELLQNQLEYTKGIGKYLAEAEKLTQMYIDAEGNPEKLAQISPEAAERFAKFYGLGLNGGDPLTKWGLEMANGEIKNAIASLGSFNEIIKLVTDQIKDLEKGLIAAQYSKTAESAARGLQSGATTLKDMADKGLTAANALTALKTVNTEATGEQNVKALKDAGYSKDEIKELGLKNLGTGISTKTARSLGFDAKTTLDYLGGTTNKTNLQNLKAGGYTYDNVKKLGFSNSTLGAVYSGSTATVTNKKGKSTSGTVAKSGNIGFNQGTSVYEYDTNKKTYNEGKSITKATVDNLKGKYGREYAQAMYTALITSKPGTKVNKNWEKLWTIAKTKDSRLQSGKTVKMSNGVTGSINRKGGVVYNSGKAGVRTWNPGKGTNGLIKYNKKDFLAKSKDKFFGREFTQVLLKNGVKKKTLQKNGSRFITGGLANYTGPAWLDGTPSKPELVLNARDTKNFLALKDILSDTMSGASTITNSSGTYEFDIDINVDEIANDYDVQQIANQIEKEIVRKARYRNVNAVSFKR